MAYTAEFEQTGHRDYPRRSGIFLPNALLPTVVGTADETGATEAEFRTKQQKNSAGRSACSSVGSEQSDHLKYVKLVKVTQNLVDISMNIPSLLGGGPVQPGPGPRLGPARAWRQRKARSRTGGTGLVSCPRYLSLIVDDVFNVAYKNCFMSLENF